MKTSDLVADAKDIVGEMADLVQTWTAVGGTPSWQVLIGQPNVTQDFQAGGYIERVTHEVRVVASATSWTPTGGVACAASLSAGAPVAALAIGKTLVATEQGNRKYRIEAQSYKPGTAWVVLSVRAEDER
jgi:hypothetical protein